MVRVRVRRPEEYEEWLSRVELSLKEQEIDARTITDITEWKSTLEETLGYRPELSEKLWPYAEQRYGPMAEAGIRAIYITYPWGSVTRYGIKGLPGLWGYESMIEIFKERRRE
jgi:hypothetical protein